VVISSPKQESLNFDRFKMISEVQNFDEREYLNPGYYEQDFDIRQHNETHRDQIRLPSQIVLSKYQNPNKLALLKKFSNESRSTLYTNTRTFASTFARSAPKFKV